MAARLLFGRQSDRACFHVQTSYVFRCHGKHGFCSHSERHKHLLLQGILAEQGDIHHSMAFIAGLWLDPWTYLRFVLHLGCEPRFGEDSDEADT